MKDFYEHLRRMHAGVDDESEFEKKYRIGTMKGRIHALLDAQFTSKGASYKWLESITGKNHVSDLTEPELFLVLKELRKRWR